MSTALQNCCEFKILDVRQNRVITVKKLILGLSVLLSAWSVQASDVLNGMVWKTIDDETKQAKSLVIFKEQPNGTLSASIQKTFNAQEETSCSLCQGTFHNKPLKGAVIVQGLKHVGGTVYEDGHITDPKNGKTYNLKGELTNNGRVLKLRGYMGVSVFGRNQTWIRVN